MRISRLVQTLVPALFMAAFSLQAQTPAAIPDNEEISMAFGAKDQENFLNPPVVYHPDTWFHFIGGNIAKEGITADLEAIRASGIKGIQLFHGQFGGPWPNVDPQITCLSETWDEIINFTASECRRLGLRYTMLACPGWAMAGGPWIAPENAMRHLVYSRTDVAGGHTVNLSLAKPQPSSEDWRNYQEVAVLAFPTPEGDTGSFVVPVEAKGNHDFPWMKLLTAQPAGFHLPGTNRENPNWVDVSFAEPTVIRSIEFSSVNGFQRDMCYEPGAWFSFEAVCEDGTRKLLREVEVPASNWQDEYPLTIAIPEIEGVRTYRVNFMNRHSLGLGHFRFYTASRKDNWEAEAAWTLRSLIRGEHPRQSKSAFVDTGRILDISSCMNTEGELLWDAPAGNWTVLRIGHVNTGAQNGPAPKEGTGWECDKLSRKGSDAQFAGYLGRLLKEDGALDGGLAAGVLMDSWECKTQTWTADMENEFARISGYELRKWLPALFGYVLGDHEISTRFLRDWRKVISDLVTDNFFGGMAENSHNKGLSISYETAIGDIIPGDIMEYYKYADVPMCEFWVHPNDFSSCGSINFKPVKPTASAARLYGKPRVAAESFTSFFLTWNEDWQRLREVANQNAIEGVTHNVFHTYTHNPQTGLFLPPGTAFGSNIGTPFLRGETWWKHMPELTDYLARCTYLLERGKPVSDVLWYLGDEFDHKPDQRIEIAEGIKYDYCNQDILLSRLSVRDGRIVTPDGISYSFLWLPEQMRLMPETVAKLLELVKAGAVVVGPRPMGMASLDESAGAYRRYKSAVKKLWGKEDSTFRRVGKGKVISGLPMPAVLNMLGIEPDVLKTEARWLHRRAENADWYFVCPANWRDFSGTMSFNCKGKVEIWDPVSGTRSAAGTAVKGNRTEVELSLPRAGSCFVVFRHDDAESLELEPSSLLTSYALDEGWTLTFPEGWDAREKLELEKLGFWRDLPADEATRFFSGTGKYTTRMVLDKIHAGAVYKLDLGTVRNIAKVRINGKEMATLWTLPYTVDISETLHEGENLIEIEVTSPWYNRLVYDGKRPENERRTWTIAAPHPHSAPQESGLAGPVVISVYK